ncbi:DUF637 domain-containing protein [Vibrio coralliilyticus]|uniref:DUF637 domain-containing protein n=1 Tax=Vibrio coralliilyticus TaxID=190893 RepID=UPI001E55C1D0|nr:DUF637 domain-containing protein [Vibrio coralliilyticus]MCC2525319.1 DUF637 domain-containing protein [Vibrio coralliilyticus]
MNKIKTPLWQKVTSNTLLAAFVTHLSFPVYASVKTNIALEEIEAAVTYTARYDLMESVDQYLYKGALESDELGIFDGFTHFSNLLSTSNPELIPGYSAESGQPVDLTTLPARFGSPYVERGVIRHQITQLLNKSWISKPGYSSYNEQTKKLYENAVEVAKENGFQLGQRLTEQQIAALRRDIVWPEIRMIGEQSYLVPFVYLTPATIQEQQLLESTFAANSAEINTQTFVVNGSRVEFKHDALIDVEQDFINTQGHVSGQKFTIRTGRELQNRSGTITGDDVTLIANKLTNDTLVTRLDYGHGFSETFNQIGTISTLGNLNIYTSGDVVSHGGQFSSQGSLEIESGGNIILVPQESKDQRAESGQRWSDSESSLVNLQTSLSAVDTLSLIAGGQVFIQGAKLESQGLLQILAGYGITLKSAADLRSYERKFEAESGGMFGTKESESESATEAEIVRTLLKAGQSMLLSTEKGNVLLEAVTIDNKGMSKIIAENGSIDFELAKLLETYSHEQSFEGSLSFRHQGNGYQREVAYYSEFINNGGLLLDGAHGVRIQVAAGSNNLDHTLAELAQTPDLAWMQDIRNNPEYSDVDWQSIELVMEQWDYDQSGLTPAAMAILSIAMAVAMGPGGLAIAGPGAGATITISNAALAAAVNAGFGSLVVQTSSSLLANGFDVGATMEQIASKESLTSLATTMVTAGVLTGLDIPMFSGENGVDLTLEDIVQGAVGASNELAVQAIMQVVNSTVSTGISSVVNGHSFEEFGDAFVQSVAMSAVMRIGKNLANKIGTASQVQEGQTEPDFDTAVKYIAHAALGCGLGTAVSSINGGNSSANQNGCASGAAGGVIGEYIAETYKDSIETQRKEIEQASLKLIDGSKQFTEQEIRAEVERLKAFGVDISRLAAAITVFAFGGDVNIAEYTAGNAAQHNALQFFYIAFQATMFILTVIEIKNTVEQIQAILEGEEDPEPLLKDALVNLLVEVSFGKLKKTELAVKTLEEIVDLTRKTLDDINPTLAFQFEGIVEDISAKRNGDSSIQLKVADDLKPISGKYRKEYDDYRNSVSSGNGVSPQDYERYRDNGWYFDEGSHRWKSTDKPTSAPDFVANFDEKVSKDIDYSLFSGPENKSLKYNVEIDGKSHDKDIHELVAARINAKKQLDITDLDSPQGSLEALIYKKQMKDLSEAIGELTSEAMIRNDLFKGRKVDKLLSAPPWSNKKNDQFDSIYIIDRGTANERIVLVEAKGGLSPSKESAGRVVNNRRYGQGHPKYNESILVKMQKDYDLAAKQVAVNPTDLQRYLDTIDDLQKHRQGGTIEYYRIETKLDQKGSMHSTNPITIKKVNEAFNNV